MRRSAVRTKPHNTSTIKTHLRNDNLWHSSASHIHTKQQEMKWRKVRSGLQINQSKHRFAQMALSVLTINDIHSLWCTAFTCHPLKSTRKHQTSSSQTMSDGDGEFLKAMWHIRAFFVYLIHINGELINKIVCKPFTSLNTNKNSNNRMCERFSSWSSGVSLSLSSFVSSKIS